MTPSWVSFPTLQQVIKKHYHPRIDLQVEAALSTKPLWCFKLRSALKILQLSSGSGWVMAVAFIRSSGWNREYEADCGVEVPPASGWLTPGLSLFCFHSPKSGIFLVNKFHVVSFFKFGAFCLPVTNNSTFLPLKSGGAVSCVRLERLMELWELSAL